VLLSVAFVVVLEVSDPEELSLDEPSFDEVSCDVVVSVLLPVLVLVAELESLLELELLSSGQPDWHGSTEQQPLKVKVDELHEYCWVPCGHCGSALPAIKFRISEGRNIIMKPLASSDRKY